MKIPLAQIQLPEKDLRSHIDQDGLDELADSMRDRGQLQSIGVRPIGEDLFEVVFGARRTRAALMLGWLEIKAEVVDDIDDANTASSKLIENVQRQDLTPIEEAYGLLELVGDEPPNFRRLQEQTGKSRDWIRNRLELCLMPDDLQEAVQSGRLGVGVAKALSTIQNDEVREYYLEYAENNNMTAEQARVWASNADAAETGIAAMRDHEQSLDERTESMPYVPPLWNCFCCREPRRQTECSTLTICRACQMSITQGRNGIDNTAPPPPIAIL